MNYQSQYNHDEEDAQQQYVELPTIKRKQKRKTRPIIANLIDTQYQVIEQVCWDLGFNIVMERDHRNWDIKWTDSAVTIDILNKLQSHQKINHFPGMNTLSRKNNLAKNMSKMQAAFPELYTFIPKTFILPGDNAIFRSYHQEARRKGLDKTFIVKPEASCQGRGIFLSQSLTGTYVEIQGYGQCIVQNYIDNPLLYKGLKFDLRIYALVAGCDPLRIYIYNEGLVRFATQKYEPVDQENIDNLYMHLTNYAINKDNPKYVFNESLDNLSLGHKKSLAEFFQTLKSMGMPAHDYWSGIKQTIVKTLISGQPHLQREYRMAQQNNFANNMCFQVLGFDFMIDDRNKLYLLEINYTPSFSTETPLDHLIKSNLIRDTILLMNVTPQARDQAQKAAKQVLDRRVFTGKMTKVTPDERQRLVREQQKERDQYQRKHLGSFEKIYPSRNQERQAKYLTLLDYAAQQYKDSLSPQKIGNSRRSNSKYRIKKILSNNTICQEEKQANKNKGIVSKNPVLNPETADKTPLFAKKLRQKLNYGQEEAKPNIFNELQNIKSTQKRMLEQQNGLRETMMTDLKTRNGQSTMFSKNYNAETAA